MIGIRERDTPEGIELGHLSTRHRSFSGSLDASGPKFRVGGTTRDHQNHSVEWRESESKE